MKLVCVSDTHGNHIKTLPEGDVLVHAGDFGSRGYYSELIKFANHLSMLKDKYKYIVCIAGNHDFIAEIQPALTRETIQSKEGIYYLDDSGITLDRVNFWGSPIQPEFCNWAFNRARGEEIKKHWDMIPDNTDVLITHGPPCGILDKLPLWGSQPHVNIGCEDLLDKVKTLPNLKAHIFGHIHEQYGTKEENGVKFVNASLLNDVYRQVNVPIVIEI